MWTTIFTVCQSGENSANLVTLATTVIQTKMAGLTTITE